MRTHIVRIGSSQGIRIPKPLLEQAGLLSEVEVTVEAGRLVIAPAVRPRAGWEEAAASMAAAGEDELLDEVAPAEWDGTKWEW